MATTLQTFFNSYFTEIIVSILIFSIVIVIISIFYVLTSSIGYKEVKQSKKIKNKKMKYTNQFLKGVDGIDLNLNIEEKKRK